MAGQKATRPGWSPCYAAPLLHFAAAPPLRPLMQASIVLVLKTHAPGSPERCHDLWSYNCVPAGLSNMMNSKNHTSSQGEGRTIGPRNQQGESARAGCWRLGVLAGRGHCILPRQERRWCCSSCSCRRRLLCARPCRPLAVTNLNVRERVGVGRSRRRWTRRSRWRRKAANLVMY